MEVVLVILESGCGGNGNGDNGGFGVNVDSAGPSGDDDSWCH